MEIQKINNQTFGMAVIYKPNESLFRNHMFDKLNDKQYIKIHKMIDSQNNNPVDIFLSVVEKNGKTKLEAKVGNETFKENIFRSSYGVIKKSVKYANKLNNKGNSK